MKKISILLVLAITLTMTACGNTTETIPGTEPIETTAPAASAYGVSIENLDYPANTTVDTFWISGTISSGAALDRMVCTVSATSSAVADVTLSDPEAFLFPEENSAYDAAVLTDYFVARLKSIYDLNTAIAGVLSADESLSVRLNATVYDVEGNSEDFVIKLVVHGEGVDEPGDGLAVKDLQYSESGTLEQFQISGTIESDVPLVKLTGHGKAKSNVVDVTVTDMSDLYYFEDGVTSVELSDVREYLLDNMGNIFNLFGIIGSENHEVTINYTFECEDEAGNTVAFEIHYVMTGE